MNQKIKIERIDPSDISEIVPLKAADDAEISHEQAREDVAIDRLVKMSGASRDFWVARDGEKAIGYAIGEEINCGYESEAIYVSPEYRNQGVGLMLKLCQVEFARSIGCKNIRSYMSASNKASVRVQEKAGFTIIKRDSGYVAVLNLDCQG